MPGFQNESKCETILMEMSSACSFIFHVNQSNFPKNGLALRLALKQARGNSEMFYRLSLTSNKAYSLTNSVDTFQD